MINYYYLYHYNATILKFSLGIKHQIFAMQNQLKPIEILAVKAIHKG